MTDLYTWSVGVFSLVFLGVIAFITYQRAARYLRKEKELNEVDRKFDAMLNQRENLLVA